MDKKANVDRGFVTVDLLLLPLAFPPLTALVVAGRLASERDEPDEVAAAAARFLGEGAIVDYLHPPEKYDQVYSRGTKASGETEENSFCWKHHTVVELCCRFASCESSGGSKTTRFLVFACCC